MARIQNLPPIFWLVNKNGVETPLNDHNVYLWHWVDGIKEVIHVQPTEDKSAEKVAEEQVLKAKAKGESAYASAFIPCNNQHGVYIYSAVGRTKEYALKDNINYKINKAYASLFGTAETEPKKKKTPMQKVVTAKKSDPEKIVIYVCYPGSSKLYTFRCKQWHVNGDEVCVYTGTPKEYKNVTVAKCVTMKESEIIALAKRIGYDDLEEVYSDEPMDFEEYYEENVAELQAERECFMPVADVVVEGDDIDYYAEKARDVDAGLYDDWLPD